MQYSEADLFAGLKRVTETIDPVLFASLDEVKDNKSLFESMHYAISTGGKRLRPALVFLCADLMNQPRGKFTDLAAAFELLHNFTLIHDDIMDRAKMRRGNETIYGMYGKEIAGMAGDAMFALAYRKLESLQKNFKPKKSLQALNWFTTATFELVKGQVREIELQSQESVSMDDYDYVIKGKTASLVVALLKSAVFLAGGKKKDLKNISVYGECLGQVFQLRDDVLDLQGGSEFGKSKGTDIKEGKKTIIVLHALSRLPEEKASRLKAILEAPSAETTDVMVDEAISLLNESKSIAFAENHALKLLEKGRKALHKFSQNRGRDFLELVLNYSWKREK
ncbi:polyprenyl synthetase family protein [archaeon]|nr:polyprenyl synthetase family protein [archaeon]